MGWHCATTPSPAGSVSNADQRGGRLFGIGLAIVIMVAYTVVHYIALAFSRADLLPPMIAAWTANIIFLGIGASLFLRGRT